VFERYDEPLLGRREFLRRVLWQSLIGVVLLTIPLVVGVIGYMALASLNLVDAFLNASMILGGMGPVDQMPNDAAKVFAGFYALFAGVFFIGVAGIILSPFVHRVLHALHAPAADDSGADSGDKENGN
jgi:hypothetical protein